MTMEQPATDPPEPHLEEWAKPSHGARKSTRLSFAIMLIALGLQLALVVLTPIFHIPQPITYPASELVAVILLLSYLCGVYHLLRLKGFRPVVWTIGLVMVAAACFLIASIDFLLVLIVMPFLIGTSIGFPIFLATRPDKTT